MVKNNKKNYCKNEKIYWFIHTIFEHFYHFNPLTYTILINKNYKCPKTNIDLKSFSHFFDFNNLFFLFKLMFIKFNKSFYLKFVSVVYNL